MTVNTPQSRGYEQRWAAARQASDEVRQNWGTQRPLDHAHLARYTLGDKALELEILDLFLDEAPHTLNRLETLAACIPCDAKAWVVGCHTLKGSAWAVGAFDVAAAAERAEIERDLLPAVLQEHVGAMGESLGAVSTYIAAWRVKP